MEARRFQAGSEEDEKGKIGEAVCVKALQDAGWMVCPKSDYAKHGAPMLQGLKVALVMPDLDISRRGERRWVEVKYRDHREYFRKWKRNIMGCELRKWEQYRAVEEETGTPCWMFWYEASRNNIFAAPCEELARPYNHRIYQGENEQDPGGNIYFDLGAFELFAVPPSKGELWTLRDKRWRLNAGGPNA